MSEEELERSIYYLSVRLKIEADKTSDYVLRSQLYDHAKAITDSLAKAYERRSQLTTATPAA